MAPNKEAMDFSAPGLETMVSRAKQFYEQRFGRPNHGIAFGDLESVSEFMTGRHAGNPEGVSILFGVDGQRNYRCAMHVGPSALAKGKDISAYCAGAVSTMLEEFCPPIVNSTTLQCLDTVISKVSEANPSGFYITVAADVSGIDLTINPHSKQPAIKTNLSSLKQEGMVKKLGDRNFGRVIVAQELTGRYKTEKPAVGAGYNEYTANMKPDELEYATRLLGSLFMVSKRMPLFFQKGEDEKVCSAVLDVIDKEEYRALFDKYPDAAEGQHLIGDLRKLVLTMSSDVLNGFTEMVSYRMRPEDLATLTDEEIGTFQSDSKPSFRKLNAAKVSAQFSYDEICKRLDKPTGPMFDFTMDRETQSVFISPPKQSDKQQHL